MQDKYAFVGLTIIAALALVVPSLQFDLTCSNATEISTTSLCDGFADCIDGVDEKYTGTGFKCRVNGNKRRCVLPQQFVHDAVTHCDDMLDSCFDSAGQFQARNCFRCLDGDQVVSVTQVCDGIVDCDDLSDECLCVANSLVRATAANPICGHICRANASNVKLLSAHCGICAIGEVVCSVANASYSNRSDVGLKHCVKPYQVCDGVRDCLEGEDEQYCPREIKCKDHETTATACDGIVTCPGFEDECESGCWNKPDFCAVVANGVFACDRNSSTAPSTSPSNFTQTLDYRQVCNSVVDCDDGELDEMFCSTSDRFYCWSGDVLFTNWSERYNGVRQCQDGSDECQGSFFKKYKTLYADTDRLVRNPFLSAIVFVLMIPALFGNAIVIVMTSRELWQDRYAQKLGRLAKCNRTLVLNLAFSDFLMGIYLLILAFELLLTWDNYCVHDRAHRTSRTCTTMGLLAQISSQTSVFMLLLMTSYRLYGTLHPFRVEESRLTGGATTLAFFSWITAIVLALMPQVRCLGDYFVKQYWLPLPFVQFDNVEKMDMQTLVLNIHALSINNANSSNILTDLRWRTMIDFVRKQEFASLDPRWHEQYVVPEGFYNRYPICQPFFYATVGDTAWLYMSAIIAFNFLAFIYIAVAYVVIYRTSSRPCVRKSVRRRTRQWRQDNRTMQKKIMCLVTTDMMCWMPVCIISLIRLLDVPTHPIVHGLTGLLLLPINSAVNPIIYSNAIFNLRSKFRKRTYNDSYSSDASDAARLIYSGRQPSGQSLDSSSLVRQLNVGSQGTLTSSPYGNRNKLNKNGVGGNSTSRRKKLSNGFVTHVTFMDSPVEVKAIVGHSEPARSDDPPDEPSSPAVLVKKPSKEDCSLLDTFERMKESVV